MADAEFLTYLKLLDSSGIRVVRERDVGIRRPDGSYARDVRAKFRQEKSHGLWVDAFVSPAAGLPPEDPGDALPEDLRRVFEVGQALRRDFAGLVDSWEMTGEPDIGYCRDLPDRLAAYQKALYLGLKAGGGHAPEVLMGALALPPGPWLERAEANGLLEYTDAYNFHFYGQAEDMAAVLGAHRSFMDQHTKQGARLPIWITECGIKAVGSADFLNRERREMQADFTVETAGEALAGGAAVFMPFILVHRGDPYALTLTADKPLPGWNAYVELTRKKAWPSRPLSRKDVRVNPIVMQWLPDQGAAVPHKVSGTYQFKGEGPMSGALRVYNLGEKRMAGRFEGTVFGKVNSTFPVRRTLVLEPGQFVTLKGAFAPKTAGYFEGWWKGDFVSEDGSRSLLRFGLEATPEEGDFRERPLGFQTGATVVERPIFANYRIESTEGAWIGINGVKVGEVGPSGARFTITELTGDPAGDPLYPPMAIARVGRLPPDGFLIVKPDRLMDGNFGVRVDFVDNIGQRFTIWENFGQSYWMPRRDLWLKLSDFHVYFWGKCSNQPVFHPEDVREMQLRFYCFQVPSSIRLNFALARPR